MFDKIDKTQEGAGTEEAPKPPQPDYVTSEKLASELKQLGVLFEKQFNAFVKAQDNSNELLQDRINKRVSALESAAEKQGITLTPSQKQQITDQATIEEVSSVAKSGGKADFTDRGPAGNTPEVDPERVNIAADTMLKLSGVEFEEGDPEVKLINDAAETGTPEQYLDAFREAIRLKKERLASGGNSEQLRSPVGGAPGAATGVPNTNMIANTMDKDELWSQAKKEGKIK